MALIAGEKAPNFTLESTTRKQFNLYLSRFGKPLILYFYPADFTLGCTNEACGYRDTFDLFKTYDIDIVGVSKDTLESHDRFKEKYNLPFELLSDPELEVAKMYDVVVPFINFTKRTTYLLDKNHMIAAVYENIFIAKNHIDEMVKRARSGKVS